MQQRNLKVIVVRATENKWCAVYAQDECVAPQSVPSLEIVGICGFLFLSENLHVEFENPRSVSDVTAVSLHRVLPFFSSSTS